MSGQGWCLESQGIVLSIRPRTSVSPWVPIIPRVFSSLFSLLLPPPSFFPYLPPPRSSPCDGSFHFGFSTSKGQSQIPWVSVLHRAQPLHLLLPPRRGQHPWVKVRARGCVACVCTCVCVNGRIHLFRALLRISS